MSRTNHEVKPGPCAGSPHQLLRGSLPFPVRKCVRSCFSYLTPRAEEKHQSSGSGAKEREGGRKAEEERGCESKAEEGWGGKRGADLCACPVLCPQGGVDSRTPGSRKVVHIMAKKIRAPTGSEGFSIIHVCEVRC